MSDVLQVTQASSEALQTRDNYDYAMATMNIKAVQLTLDQWRNTTEQPRGFFEQSWNKTIVTLRRYKVLPKIPRVSAKTRSRLNLTSNEPYEYYRKALALPLLDHMRSELRIRFDSRSNSFAVGFSHSFRDAQRQKRHSECCRFFGCSAVLQKRSSLT